MKPSDLTTKSPEWLRKRDQKLRYHGEIDYKKKLIRVKKKKDDAKGELIDTIVHEEIHRVSPKMHEKNVRKTAAKLVEKMRKQTKQKLYALYR